MATKKQSVIYSNLKAGTKKYGEPYEVFRYRGYELGVWCDDPGQCLFTIWHGDEITFGTYNLDFEKDCKYYIDSELDDIYCDHNGMLIKWNTNEWSPYRDIICQFRSRLVKVWLVDQDHRDQVDIEAIKQEAKELCETLEQQRLERLNNGDKEAGTYISDLIKQEKDVR